MCTILHMYEWVLLQAHEKTTSYLGQEIAHLGLLSPDSPGTNAVPGASYVALPE